MLGIYIPEWFVFINFLTWQHFSSMSQSYCFFLVFLNISRGTYLLNSCLLRKSCLFIFLTKWWQGFAYIFSWFTILFLRTFYTYFIIFLQFNVLYSLSVTALQCGRITFHLHLLHKPKELLPLREPLKTLNLEPILQREGTQKEKNKCINSYIQNLEKWYWKNLFTGEK